VLGGHHLRGGGSEGDHGALQPAAAAAPPADRVTWRCPRAARRRPQWSRPRRPPGPGRRGAGDTSLPTTTNSGRAAPASPYTASRRPPGTPVRARRRRVDPPERRREYHPVAHPPRASVVPPHAGGSPGHRRSSKGLPHRAGCCRRLQAPACGLLHPQEPIASGAGAQVGPPSQGPTGRRPASGRGAAAAADAEGAPESEGAKSPGRKHATSTGAASRSTSLPSRARSYSGALAPGAPRHRGTWADGPHEASVARRHFVLTHGMAWRHNTARRRRGCR